MDYRVGDEIKGIGPIERVVRNSAGKVGYWIREKNDSLAFYFGKDLITISDMLRAIKKLT
jgi:hypothetical protein